MKRLIPFMAAALLVAGCIDMEPFLYRCMTMGYAKSDGSLRADDGNTYYFEGIDVTWKAGDRLLAVMDVTEAIRDSVYKAKNVSVAYPLYKKPIYIAQGQEVPDTLGHDEIIMNNGWYSGGCLNMLSQIKTVPETGPHIVNLLIEPGTDTLFFTLKHRSDAEVAKDIALSPYSFYASFPISEFLPEKDSIAVKIQWFWDGEDGSVVTKMKR